MTDRLVGVVHGEHGSCASASLRAPTICDRRLVKRKGKMKALVAIARDILEIVWHLLADPTVRYRDLGSDYHTLRVNTARRIRDHVQGLEASRLHRHHHHSCLT